MTAATAHSGQSSRGAVLQTRAPTGGGEDGAAGRGTHVEALVLPDQGGPGGAAGRTLESCTYRDRLDEFARLGAAVRGVSTRRPAEQAAFAAASGSSFRCSPTSNSNSPARCDCRPSGPAAPYG
ncbi:hypothetical protein [Plantactinospora sp. KLBMP9567]|uniref:hypothetical protein n=1 Tax=Plantactinospora sp. KLBMP9567 TaxID=3085900 RepID=UPI0029822B14|nr:hypothetical protein [Plantactinospora sp. KLBMP9567]MDW5326231.1 hypothetical protein [Plantactinospora sp. KLBMP9567]